MQHESKEVGGELRLKAETQYVEELGQHPDDAEDYACPKDDRIEKDSYFIWKAAKIYRYERGHEEGNAQESCARDSPQQRAGKSSVSKTHWKIGHESSSERVQENVEQAYPVGWSPPTRLLPQSDYDSREPGQGYRELRD